MSPDSAMNLLNETLLTAAMVAAPALLVVLTVGLLISVVQVATQVQEMTLTFVPKLIALGVTLVFLGGWMLTTVVEFARRAILAAASL